jgi:hypothetical protein
MMLRTLLTFVNLATIAVAFTVLFEYPQYAGIAFYVLLGWMIGSLVLLYGPWSSRSIGRGSGAAGPGRPPMPGTFPSALPTDLGFCIYCAAPLPIGARTCPACGHAAPSA